MSEEKIIKAYKGFNRDMTCRGFQYEEGKEYKEERAECCNVGFHACEYPLDVFEFYAPGTSVFHEVEQSGEISKDADCTKVASSKIRIGAEIGIPGIVKAAIEYTKRRTTMEYTDPKKATAGEYGAATAWNCGAATAGEYGAATAGEYGAATAGKYGAATAGKYGAATAWNCGTATTGNCGTATAGYCGAATAGKYGAATAGNCGAATAGEYGTATAGYCGAATAGNCGTATSRGSAETGKNGLSVARGNNVRVKGGLGAVLIIAEECEVTCDLEEWKAEVVDGEIIKADIWYKLENGKFVEVS